VAMHEGNRRADAGAGRLGASVCFSSRFNREFERDRSEESFSTFTGIMEAARPDRKGADNRKSFLFRSPAQGSHPLRALWEGMMSPPQRAHGDRRPHGLAVRRRSRLAEVKKIPASHPDIYIPPERKDVSGRVGGSGGKERAAAMERAVEDKTGREGTRERS